MTAALVEEQLRTDGFAKVGLLDSSEVAAATRVAAPLSIPDDAGFWTTNVHASRQEATAASEALLDIGRAAARRALPGQRPIWAALLAKGPCGDNWVMPHQDWDYVDERVHRSAVLWCPLVDTSTRDGLLHVVAGSHRWIDNRRGSGLFPEPFAPHLDLLTSEGTGLEVEAGQAIAYDGGALHYSPPNEGDRLRLVMGLVLVPDDASPVHLHSIDGRAADLFHVDPRIFTDRPFRARPPGDPAEEVPFGTTSISEGTLRAHLSAAT